MWMDLCRGSALWFVGGVEAPKCTDLLPVGYHGFKFSVMCDCYHHWLLSPAVFKQVSTKTDRNNYIQNMVMLDELQDSSYLLSLRDLVVCEVRAAEASWMSQFATQQDTKIVTGAGRGVSTLDRENTALSRWYPAPKWGKGFLIPPLKQSGEQRLWLLTGTRHLLVLGSNISAWGTTALSARSHPLRDSPGLPPTALCCTSTVLALWPPTINPSKTFVNIFWHTALQTSKSEHICKVINFFTNCLDLLL